MRGYFQSDGRTAVGSSASAFHRGLLLRRVRPVWVATLGTVAEVRLMPDFGGAAPTIYDAHLDLHFSPAFNLRSGKFKPPIGLERLMSATDLAFVERAHPTNIAPNRDIGLQLYGDLRLLRASYAIGVFNGVPDIGFAESDPDRFKDVVWRFVIEPLRGREQVWPGEIMLGIAGSSGEHRGTTANPQLQTYRSPLQEAFFRFRSDGTVTGTTIADGPHTRLAPQGYVSVGGLGVIGEYIRSEQTVRRATTYGTLTNTATNLTATWLLSGERASYRGVTPRRPFDPLRHQYGAFELAGRFSTLTVDRDAFPVFADSATQARDGRTVGAAFNWYLGRGVRVMLDYTVTRYLATAGITLPSERAISSRFQFSF
ncbi:MAG: OprO/OprP family phosphate-selective porin [Gemmatimonadaceae bacterium]